MPRFYESKYPDVRTRRSRESQRCVADLSGAQVDQLVMVQVQSIEEMGAYVKLVSISFLLVVRCLRPCVLPPQAETGS